MGPAPLAVLLCNESNDVDRAATHLLDELLVSAIVGTGDSATTLGVAHDVTVPGGALLISPRAVADLSALAGSGLLWRTCPSDALEGAAIVALADGIVLPAVIADNQLSTVRVALVHATDVESTELDAIISTSLQLNGALATDPSNAGNFIHVDFGDPDALTDVDASAAFATAVDAVTAAASLPDVIVLVGSTQAVSNVLAGVEHSWPSGARLPQYILSSGLETQELLTLAAANDSLRTRIVGTAPGGNGANVDAFYGRYLQAFAGATAPQIFGVAQAYDALYTLAFAEAVTLKALPLGTDLSAALHLVVSTRDASTPVPVDIGPTGIPAAFAALASGQSLAMNGASAPLDFQSASNGVVTDVQIWCMVQGTTPGPIVFQRTGSRLRRQPRPRSRARSAAAASLDAGNSTRSAALDGLEHGARPIAHPELGEDARHVVLHRALGDEERATDLAVGIAGHQQAEHLALPRRDVAVGRRGGRGAALARDRTLGALRKPEAATSFHPPPLCARPRPASRA